MSGSSSVNFTHFAQAKTPATGRLTIDLEALADNWRFLSKKSKRAETAAVIKADAYGLGIEPVAQALFSTGCKSFFVATYEEALAVRRQLPEARIFVLSGIYDEAAELCHEYRLVPVLSSPQMIEKWLGAGSGDLPCTLHIETGINRTALTTDELGHLIGNKGKMERLNLSLIMSHFACADEPDDPANDRQIEKFKALTRPFGSVKKSLANSAGIFLGQKAQFDLTRPGIALYGGEAVNHVENPMQPVVKLETRILQIREAKRGEAIGYGRTHELERDSKIAICGVGYADGLLRSASPSGVSLRRLDDIRPVEAMIAGQRISYLGRISMDLTVFDVTDVPLETLGKAEWIELLNKEILVDDLACAAGTIGYEILTSLGNRYERIYLEDNSAVDETAV